MNFHSIDAYQAAASDLLKPDIWDFIEGRTGRGLTLGRNQQVFADTIVNGRTLVDAVSPQTAVTVFGRPWPTPLGIAPTALHTLADPEGELATVRAAQSCGVPMVVSAFAHYPIEEIAAERHQAHDPIPLWAQVYLFKDRNVTYSLMDRARQCGASAIVVTLDSPQLGQRHPALHAGFRAPSDVHAGNLALSLGADLEAFTVEEYSRNAMDPSVTWDDVADLIQRTPLPVVAKGIMNATDACLAIDAGAQAIWVSNHGGRQFDRGRSTLDVLPEVVAVAGSVPVMMDGGIRNGMDVLIACALGAQAVFIGRPVLYGLAVSGEDGVRSLLSLMSEELVDAMMQTGWGQIKDVDASLIASSPAMPVITVPGTAAASPTQMTVATDAG
ncbi:alpha-hydroxy acid oxidase [Nonomuraea sp. NPDC003707]